MPIALTKKLDSKDKLPLSPSDYKGILRRFKRVTNARLEKTKSVLSTRQKEFLEVLPLLFHMNHASLPGFVSQETPSGIALYNPDKPTIRTLRRIARSVDLRRQAVQRLDIEALFIMGSAGTIAYSISSDFDIWLCHRNDLKNKQIRQLKQKSDLISIWAEKLGLEVHFFLMSPNELREGRHEELSSESSGSAQHHLLMDEFYRTGILIAGKYPLWWLVPPGREKNYTDYTQNLFKKRFIKEHEFIDLGMITSIPVSEFFGASLWQLYKAISSSYKSLLKILLLEIYATEYPLMDLMCHTFKRRVYAGKTKLEHLDPYLLLIKKIDSYLQNSNDTDRVQIARHSFYFKANHHLSHIRNIDNEPLLSAFINLTESWGWDAQTLKLLDERKHWKVEHVIKERALLVKSIMKSYRELSNFVRDKQEFSSISQSDMNLLGRRLFAAFERKAGKIELINPGISDDLSEKSLFLQRSRNGGWKISRPLSKLEPHQAGEVIKRSSGLIELLAWGQVNKVITTDTNIVVVEPDHNLKRTEIKPALKMIGLYFDEERINHPSILNLSHHTHVDEACLFINMGKQPEDNFLLEGVHLSNEQMDPLNYGKDEESLALSFDYLYSTSWGEIRNAHYDKKDALLHCMMEHLRHVQVTPAAFRKPLRILCQTRGRGLRIAQRIELLFNIAAQKLINKNKTAERFITRISGQYILIHRENQELFFKHFQGYRELMGYLSKPMTHFCSLHVDTEQPALKLLRFHANANKENRVQVFYQVIQHTAKVTVLDEKGTFFLYKTSFYQHETFVSQIENFISSIQLREQQASSLNDVMRQYYPIEYFELLAEPSGELRRRDVTPTTSILKENNMELQVLSESVEGKRGFSIFVDGNEFSTLEYGKDLFDTAARYITSQRDNGESYPIYITDIDLTNLIHDRIPGNLQTSDYLRYKHFIEAKLNNSLNNISLKKQHKKS